MITSQAIPLTSVNTIESPPHIPPHSKSSYCTENTARKVALFVASFFCFLIGTLFQISRVVEGMPKLYDSLTGVCYTGAGIFLLAYLSFTCKECCTKKGLSKKTPLLES